MPQRVRTSISNKAQDWLHCQKIKAFYSQVDGVDYEFGAHALLQASGLGKMKPNILMMGYKSDWKTCDRTALSLYFNTLQ